MCADEIPDERTRKELRALELRHEIQALLNVFIRLSPDTEIHLQSLPTSVVVGARNALASTSQRFRDCTGTVEELKAIAEELRRVHLMLNPGTRH